MIIIDSVLPGIHVDERVPDYELDEWVCVDLTHNEADGVGCGIGVGEHDEFVATDSFIMMELVG